jgi:hypothetical protein
MWTTTAKNNIANVKMNAEELTYLVKGVHDDDICSLQQEYGGWQSRTLL